MNKIVLLLLMIVCLSCSKKKEIESIFIADKNEYWEDRDYCYNSGGNCFRFNGNGSYDRYLMSIDKPFFRLFNNDGDVMRDPGTWSIQNDSIFVWDKGVYKIEKLSKNEILLSYYHYEIKDKKCYVRLSKWIKTAEGPKNLSSQDNTRKY